MGNKHSRVKDLSKDVNINHFKIKNVIGVGGFGRVRVAVHRSTQKAYAIKYFKKEELAEKQAIKLIIEERDILASLEFPFIVNLRFSFQDDTYAYMVLDLMDCDLALFMKQKPLDEETITQIIAMLLDTVVFLHGKNLIHRDIKPENILMDSKGYPALTDFNTCKPLKRGETISGIAGTQTYLAPEAFEGGYDHTADFWAVGITLYLMLYKVKPYAEVKHSKPNKATYLNPIKFDQPTHIPYTSPLFNLCRSLLVMDPKLRLGNPDLELQVMQHPAIVNVDLPTLRKKELSLQHACAKPKLPDILHIQGQILDGDGILAETKGPKQFKNKIFENHYKTFDYLKIPLTA